MQEQFGYAYDKAWNLNERTNNAMVETFNVNDVNELSTISRGGTLTVAGTTTEPGNDVTSVTVNGQTAAEYADGTFAKDGFTPADGENTYTAIASDNVGSGRWSTNTVSVYLPSSGSYTYDSNGNLTSDGTRNFAYDDENQLISVTVSNAWQSQFQTVGLNLNGKSVFKSNTA